MARYYEKNGKHYFLYDEPVPEQSAVISNTVKLSEGRVDVIRRGGGMNVHMFFEQGRPCSTLYVTGVGELTMDIETESVKLTVSEQQIEALVHYQFSMNGTWISGSSVRITAKAGTKGGYV